MMDSIRDTGRDVVKRASGIRRRYQLRAGIALAAGVVILTSPAAAQGSTIDVCNTQLVQIITNLIDVAISVGPLIGLFGALVGLIMQGQVSNQKKKEQWKKRRNDSFLYGVIGVLAIGAITQFALSIAGLSSEDACSVGFLDLGT